MAKSQASRSFRAKVVDRAMREKDKMACSRKTAGKRGYFTSCHSDGGHGPPELWCADFVRWVWWKAGAINAGPNTHILTPAAASFGDYGRVRRSRPRVGDAVLFGYSRKAHTAAHVAIVVQVNADGTIVSVGGDEGGEPGTDAHFAATSRVCVDGPYNGAHGSVDPSSPGAPHPLSGYVSPVEDDMPYTKKQIRNLVKQAVAAELHAGLNDHHTTAAQGAQAAVDAERKLTGLEHDVADLSRKVQRALDAQAATTLTTTPPADPDGAPADRGTPAPRASSGTPVSPSP
jgi:CHAP domain-containing protein